LVTESVTQLLGHSSMLFAVLLNVGNANVSVLLLYV
jgi:hypothetical protein